MIIVVDDDEAVLGAVTFALEAEGYAVRSFASASAILAAAGLNEASCMVIDNNLPDGPGLELLATLRNQGVRTPCVIITTNPPQKLLAQASKLRAPVVEKPLLGDRLFACIRQIADLDPSSAHLGGRL